VIFLASFATVAKSIIVFGKWKKTILPLPLPLLFLLLLLLQHQQLLESGGRFLVFHVIINS
jgi:hypothetical protein